MRIATYNVNGINGRLEGLLAWLAEKQPDVACLQELKAPDARFPAAALARAGYGAIWQGESRWNGVAILARDAEPIQTRRGLPGDPADTQSRYIEAAVNGVIVASLYAPNGNPRPGPKFEFKLRWLDRLHAHAAGLLASGHPVVLAGDFNIIPEPRDVYAPERWVDDALFHAKVREAYGRLLDQGWTDALRTRFPSQTVYTFWKYWRDALARDAGLRIDHLLLSPDLAPRLTDAGVDRAFRAREGASDHAAVWIELTDKKARRTKGSPTAT
ncbi:MAG: exodeoxyribonuclease III [Alphaproteobacteria bacterium]|nr:exodeoxyribonuclease III [Alphaproteobacteria bacterium]MBU1514241.1 exodeoxyribonuclease III [Alphaproteobacteria bacterium]MBU2093313.1 exodeoxyribonuclease III [Alphaproteobacteria bacterium]MBU2153404.1 exodeoxyribonuclease III [Alphaproteobacteria bacterium]MBU2307095.1 exodeoxyribonuclease III [Alphaproteobacteria bacterium]